MRWTGARQRPTHYPAPRHSTCDIGAYEGSVNLPLFNANLLRNGDAEAECGSSPAHSSRHLTGRCCKENLRAVRYGNTYGFRAVAPTSLPHARLQSFAGGSAVIVASHATTERDRRRCPDWHGPRQYAFPGDFGGYVTDNDRAKMQVSFLNQSYISIGGPITIGDFDATYRGNQNGAVSC